MVFEVRVLIPRYDPFQVDPFQSNLILGIKWISAGIPGSLLRAPIVFMFAGWLDFNYIAAPPQRVASRHYGFSSTQGVCSYGFIYEVFALGFPFFLLEM